MTQLTLTHHGSELPRGPMKSRVVQLPATKEPEMSFRTALLAAIVAIFRFRAGMIQTLAACSAAGVGLHLLGAIG